MNTEQTYKKICDHFTGTEYKEDALYWIINDGLGHAYRSWCVSIPTISGANMTYMGRLYESLVEGNTHIFGSDDDEGEINLDRINQALDQMKMKSPESYSRIQNSKWDEYVADEFFQTVLFGMPIYV